MRVCIKCEMLVPEAPSSGHVATEIQLEPGEYPAKQIPNPLGETEAWVVLIDPPFEGRVLGMTVAKWKEQGAHFIFDGRS